MGNAGLSSICRMQAVQCKGKQNWRQKTIFAHILCKAKSNIIDFATTRLRLSFVQANEQWYIPSKDMSIFAPCSILDLSFTALSPA